jgi:hypothetical protein
MRSFLSLTRVGISDTLAKPRDYLGTTLKSNEFDWSFIASDIQIPVAATNPCTSGYKLQRTFLSSSGKTTHNTSLYSNQQYKDHGFPKPHDPAHQKSNPIEHLQVHEQLYISNMATRRRESSSLTCDDGATCYPRRNQFQRTDGNSFHEYGRTANNG